MICRNKINGVEIYAVKTDTNLSALIEKLLRKWIEEDITQ